MINTTNTYEALRLQFACSPHSYGKQQLKTPSYTHEKPINHACGAVQSLKDPLGEVEQALPAPVLAKTIHRHDKMTNYKDILDLWSLPRTIWLQVHSI